MAKFAGLLLLAVATVLLSDNAEGFGMLRVGGTGKERPANEKIQHLVSKMKSKTEEFLDRKFDKFVGVSYKSQIVAGTNYFIKVKVDNNEYVHLRVFVPLPFMRSEPQLANALDGKEKTDPLEYINSAN
ncbi:cystatin-B-like [Rhopilema esculentum]|uniref:cystatin-B-like n=1 Tax=Rhopilema esculentum TaxID=499914 RepID=UPI0031D93A8C|eukprot:gene17359-8947_t